MFPVVIDSIPVVVRVGSPDGNWGIENHVTGEVFASAEKRNQDEGSDDEQLQKDGEKESATLATTRTLLEFGVSFEQAGVEEHLTIIRAGSSDHHTPPKKSSEAVCAAPVS